MKKIIKWVMSNNEATCLRKCDCLRIYHWFLFKSGKYSKYMNWKLPRLESKVSFYKYCTSCVHNKGCIVLDLDTEPEKYREAQFLQVLQALPIRHLFVRLEWSTVVSFITVASNRPCNTAPFFLKRIFQFTSQELNTNALQPLYYVYRSLISLHYLLFHHENVLNIVSQFIW